MSTPLEQKALLALRQYSLFTQGDRIAVGVSGGADSVALLRFLAVLREEYRWELIVCHIHHGLRGAEADRDEQFVRELAGQLAINPNTIQRAYRELESEGYILSVAGKGSFVAQVDRLAEQQKKEALNAFRAAAQRLRALGLSAEALASLLTQEELTDD